MLNPRKDNVESEEGLKFTSCGIEHVSFARENVGLPLTHHVLFENVRCASQNICFVQKNVRSLAEIHVFVAKNTLMVKIHVCLNVRLICKISACQRIVYAWHAKVYVMISKLYVLQFKICVLWVLIEVLFANVYGLVAKIHICLPKCTVC